MAALLKLANIQRVPLDYWTPQRGTPCLDNCSNTNQRPISAPWRLRDLLPGLGWLEPPKFTRAWEPTLLRNHFIDRVLKNPGSINTP
jgi:hypothetical protein